MVAHTVESSSAAGLPHTSRVPYEAKTFKSIGMIMSNWPTKLITHVCGSRREVLNSVSPLLGKRMGGLNLVLWLDY